MVRDTVISSKFWTLWILETLDIVPVKKLNFPNFCRHLEFPWKQKLSFIVRDGAISSKFWTLWVLETSDIMSLVKVEFSKFLSPS